MILTMPLTDVPERTLLGSFTSAMEEVRLKVGVEIVSGPPTTVSLGWFASLMIPTMW